jgi:hypothetical protein
MENPRWFLMTFLLIKPSSTGQASVASNGQDRNFVQDAVKPSAFTLSVGTLPDVICPLATSAREVLSLLRRLGNNPFLWSFGIAYSPK